MSGFSRGLRANLRDAVELFILPGCVAMLPARVGFALAQYLAGQAWLYREAAHRALAIAAHWQPIADPHAWLARHRLMRLRDHSDLFLWLWRRKSWFRERVVVEGAWPTTLPFIAITFHWGNGHWGLHSLRTATGGFAGVAAAPRREQFPGRPVLYRYAALRTRATAEILGLGLAFRGAAARDLVAALRGGVSICGLFDVPAHGEEKVVDVPILGQTIKMPRGFVRLAVLHKLPIVTFACEPDAAGGGAKVTVDPPQWFSTQEAAAQYLGERLSSLISREPAYWHHWHMLAAARAEEQRPV